MKSAVILAAGTGSRFGGDKLSQMLLGKPVLQWSVEAFLPVVDEVVIVTDNDEWKQLFPFAKFVKGGQDRHESVKNGLLAISKQSALVAIHDGARPLVTPEIISAAIHEAVLNRAAAPAIPVRDTIKVAENGVVTATPERASLFAVQTPQTFDADVIKAALTDAVVKNLAVTDDCAAAEAMGVTIRLTPGSDENLKITTPIDLLTAEGILRKRGGLL